MENLELAPKRLIGEILSEQGLVGVKELEKGLSEQRRNGGRIGEVLLGLHFLSERALAESLSHQLGYPFFDLSGVEISSETLFLVPEFLAKKYLVIPVRVYQKELTVAMVDPLSFEAINDLGFYCGYTVRPVISTKKDISHAIARYYSKNNSFQEITESQDEGLLQTPIEENIQKGHTTIEETESQAPAVRLVNMILGRAIRFHASDVHIEPGRENVMVRFRLDGLLRKEFVLPKRTHGPIVSRIKILARLDIAEKRLPQDGSVRVRFEKQELDIRVATLPTQYGEKVVMRILDSSQFFLSLEGVGFTSILLEKVKRLLSHRSGIVLVTGPTGSGKTSTLYAMIEALRSEGSNIVTAEDPIEYSLSGINQTQINPDIGLTFAKCLRSFLRQDPNIILLGEIRDLETAEIAFRAAMTGHLVLSTLHTRDASSSVVRLMELGVPSYIVSSLLVGVVAQRLIRSLCLFCRTEDHPSPTILRKVGISEKDFKKFLFYRSSGCQKCHGEGFKGRFSIFEVLEVDQRIEEMILQEAPQHEIKDQAITSGMSVLGKVGIQHVKDGRTSLEELLRVIDIENHFSMFCNVCGQPVLEEYNFCPNCSQSFHNACSVCGKVLKKEWRICPYCSHRCDESKEV